MRHLWHFSCFIPRQEDRMNKKTIIITSLFTVLFSFCAIRAQAAVRIDRAWVKAMAVEYCVPSDAAQAANNCQAEFNACEAEYERMMDGIFFTFCRGTNPGICNIVGNDVYEFSNQGYGDFVVSPSDRFLFTDPTVRAAHACTAEKKGHIIAYEVNSINDHSLAYTVQNEGPVAAYKLKSGDAYAVAQGSPAIPAIPAAPPVQEEPAANNQIPINPNLELPTAGTDEVKISPEEIPAQVEEKIDTIQNPSPSSVKPENLGPVQENAGLDSVDRDSVVRAALNGGGCSLQSTAPGSWMSSLLTILVFGLFPLIKTRKC